MTRHTGNTLVAILAGCAGVASGYAMANGTSIVPYAPLLAAAPIVGGGVAAAGGTLFEYGEPGPIFRATAGKSAIYEAVGFGLGYLAGWL